VSHRWGPYTVALERLGAEGMRVRVLGRRGLRHREVRDVRLEVFFVELTARPPRELRVRGYSGGAHCCWTDYLFTQEDGLRNLLLFAGGNSTNMEVRDLDRDGLPELIAWNDVFVGFDGLCYVCFPLLPLVIGWDGRAYRDHTRRFPDLLRKHLEESRWQVETMRRKGAEAGHLRGAALGYYAAALLLGQGATAEASLRRLAPEPVVA
jgi:hypothetical protein